MSASLPAAPGQALTVRQAEIYRHVYETTRDTGIQPSVREICDHFRISPNAVNGFFRSLASKGYIARDGFSHSRSLRFLLRPDGSPFMGFADKEHLDAD